MRQAHRNGRLRQPAAPLSPRAQTKMIAEPAGAVELRILVPDTIEGLYLHVQGGGLIVAGNDAWDTQPELFGREPACACPGQLPACARPSVPAAVDDCVSVAEWLADPCPTRVRLMTVIDRRRIRRAQFADVQATSPSRPRPRRGGEPAFWWGRSFADAQRAACRYCAFSLASKACSASRRPSW